MILKHKEQMQQFWKERIPFFFGIMKWTSLFLETKMGPWNEFLLI